MQRNMTARAEVEEEATLRARGDQMWKGGDADAIVRTVLVI